ncbi:MAG: hypothetical protein IJI60_03810 [Bacilli bacterium]|nr:hypothetical protein [Bacilli bacterium]
MIKKDLLKEYLGKNNIQTNKNYQGIKLSINKKEILIKGTQLDLIELADYILDIALSEEKRNHVHLGKDTLLNDNSEMEELIIEKEE